MLLNKTWKGFVLLWFLVAWVLDGIMINLQKLQAALYFGVDLNVNSCDHIYICGV